MKIVKSTEKWFPIPDDPDGAEIQIRHLDPGDYRRIAERTMQSVQTVVDGEVVFENRFSPTKDASEKTKAAVIGWKNVLDADGNPLKFNKANLEKVIDGVPGFVVFVRGKVEELAKEAPAGIEETEKN